ncbi:hypothetical protein CI102_4468 [Trichoderma harzianum]|uniref:Oxidoreductase n=1 Tax=Trichoderma harzianum CBS 226.95 TaxID=983964 RepID=A0A2T3ZS80_TRIHA|nr:hypothetical protein M431DRAFT_514271 [Trichoderma harzianum CBS 226.95]PKK50822.1 hypothetical protein CI102_4468 [Trichoderma harzianum]PTB47660.1 hypothetical protein M431DRAFT_514271 [Trichoderma harzianum CBS 226.95]
MLTKFLHGPSFISGAARGIGKATAFAFAKYGSPQVAIADVDTATLKQTAKELKDLYPNVEILPIEFDAANADSTIKAIETAYSKFGRIDHAVNNVGTPGPLAPSISVSTSDFKNLIDINLTSMWIAQREQIKIMLKQEPVQQEFGKVRGTIVNMSSVWGGFGTRDFPAGTAYSTTKHGIRGLTKSDANQYASEGIRINAICPGYTFTTIDIGNEGPELQYILDQAMHRTAMKRFAQPEEIANGITYLSSWMSSYMSGEAMLVDGGFSS